MLMMGMLRILKVSGPAAAFDVSWKVEEGVQRGTKLLRGFGTSLDF